MLERLLVVAPISGGILLVFSPPRRFQLKFIFNFTSTHPNLLFIKSGLNRVGMK